MDTYDRGGPEASRPTGTSSAAAAFREYVRIQRRARTIGNLVAVGALAVVAGVVGLCYRTARTNFSEARVRAAASDQAEQLLPVLSEHGMAVLREVEPTYAAEGKKALREAMPELQKSMEHELVDLAKNLSKRTDETIGAAFLAAGRAAEDELRASFPKFHDAAYLEGRLGSLEDRLQDETHRFLEETAKECAPSQEKFVETLSRFPRLRELSDEELQRRFLHLWLLLVDYELTGVATNPAAEGSATSTTPAATRKG